jgi:preprotein translocase subunit SecA
VITAFLHLLRRIDEKVVKTFNSAEITSQGMDMDARGLKASSATWTYLINDTPFGDWNIFAALKSPIKEAMGRDRD